MSTVWSDREDVAGELEEGHGWTPSPESWAWSKNGARWFVTMEDSRVMAPDGSYTLIFAVNVPAPVIVAACEAVATS